MDGFRFKTPRSRAMKSRPNYLALVLIISLVFFGWRWSSQSTHQTKGTELRQVQRDETIFVSVGAYRDRDCAATIKEIFSKAARPQRITVGLCEQNMSDHPEEECYDPSYEWSQNIRLVNSSYKAAKGPTYSRAICSKLYDGETYFMQIDSHNVFAPGWDELCIEDLKKCPSPKPVVSYYPHDMKTNLNATSVPVLCVSEFNWNNITTFQAVPMDAPKSGIPRPIPFVAGGFMFGPGSIPKDVPFDLDLPHLFAGEEILYAARLWTSGYDMYAPMHNYLWHLYGRGGRPKYWEDGIPGYDEGSKTSQDMVKRILGFDGQPPMKDTYHHGMGLERSLEKYLEFAGIDIVTMKTTTQEKFCVDDIVGVDVAKT